MPGKTPPTPESDTNLTTDPHTGNSVKPPPLDLFPSTPNAPAKSADPASQLTQVRVESIEELDRSQRLLSKVIDLAIAVSDVRLATGSAWNSVQALLGGGLSGAGAKWEALAESLQAVGPLEAWPSDGSGPSEALARSLERFGRARPVARGKAESIVDSAPFGDPTREQAVELRGAIRELQDAAGECSKACEAVSRNLVERIRHRVQVILEQLERKRESVSEQSEGVLRPAEVKEEPTVGTSALNRDLTKTKEGSDVVARLERSDEPWIGTP
jgi:hypothetical protein